MLESWQSFANRSLYIIIKMNDCLFISLFLYLFVCLFFMYSVLVRARAAKLCRNTSFIKGKTKSHFSSRNYGSPSQPHPKTPYVSNQWDFTIPWYSRSILQDCMVIQKMSHQRFSRIVSSTLSSLWLKSYGLALSQ